MINTARVPAERTAAELRRHWASEIELFHPGTDQGLVKLQAASARFVAGPWLPIVIEQRWDELEIWGAFPAPLEFARRRGDCAGLVPSLVLGRGCSLVEIGPEFAIVTRRDTGSRLRHQRTLGGGQWSRPWWEALETPKEDSNVV